MLSHLKIVGLTTCQCKLLWFIGCMSSDRLHLEQQQSNNNTTTNTRIITNVHSNLVYRPCRPASVIITATQVLRVETPTTQTETRTTTIKTLINNNNSGQRQNGLSLKYIFLFYFHFHFQN